MYSRGPTPLMAEIGHVIHAPLYVSAETFPILRHTQAGFGLQAATARLNPGTYRSARL